MSDRAVWVQKIEDLINEFPDEIYLELLEEMVDHAQTALDARREEENDEEDE